MSSRRRRHPGRSSGTGLVALSSLCASISLSASILCAQAPAKPQDPAPDAGAERVLQLTLDDALRIGLRNNLELEIQHLSSEQARYNELGSWGAFDPVLSLSGSAEDNQSEQRNAFSGASVVKDNSLGLQSSLSMPFTTGGNLDLSLSHLNAETNSSFASFDVATTDVLTVALTQPLLRGAWRHYATSNQKLSEIALERQIESERKARANLLLALYIAYWDLVSAQEELAVRELAVDLGNQQLAQDQRRLEVGAGTEVDVLQSETNVAQAEQRRLLADYAVREARDNLRRLLSPRPEGDYQEFLERWDWPIRTLTTLPEVAPDVHLDWRASLHMAIEQRPELAQARLDIQTAEVSLVQARSEKQPLLDLSLSSSSAGFDTNPSDAFNKASGWDFPSNSAALTFSMPLWNRTASNAERSARSGLRSATLAYDQTELDILAEVRTSINDVDRARDSVAAAAKSRTLAQRQLAAERTRQEVGLSTTFQVLQFQEDLAQALSTEVAAKAAFAKALAKIAEAEGRIGVDIEPAPASATANDYSEGSKRNGSQGNGAQR